MGKMYMGGREKKYYNRIRWGIEMTEEMRSESIDIKKIMSERDLDNQRQMEVNRIESSRYNREYRNVMLIGEDPKYLRKESLEKLKMGDSVRALVNLRCGNWENWNRF